MNNLNEYLQLPPQVQEFLNQIENIPLPLAEIKIPDHPKLPNFDRYIQYTGMDIVSDNQFILFKFRQVLRDKETNEYYSRITLPTPLWAVYADTWSYFRTQTGEVLELPLKEEHATEESTTGKVRVPSYKYMLWLMNNHQARFLELLQVYANDFVSAKIEELNAF